MSSNYVVTAHKPTAVTASALGNFTSKDDLNLIVAKNTRLEIFTITPEGLKLIKEVGVYGMIAVMKLYRPKNADKDVLLITTARHHAMVLDCEQEGQVINIITKAYGNVQDRVGRPSESGIIGRMDHKGRYLGLRLHDGMLKVIPLDHDTKELKSFNIRLEEIKVKDIAFLSGYSEPTVIILYEDIHGRHVKTYEISMKDREFLKGPWKQENVETEANLLIAVPEPLCGALIIGQESITYHNGDSFIAQSPPSIKQSMITCYGRVDSDGRRYLLADQLGRLFMLLLNVDHNVVKDLKTELLGETSIAECITYIDNGVIFIGSRLGDSQLIKLNIEPDKEGSYVQVLESFTNLGPIVDMCVVDLEKQGQGQLLTCSGIGKEGSIRIIRNGIGLNELASIDLSDIKGIFALKFFDSKLDNVLVLSFVGQTRVLLLSGEEMEEVEVECLELDQQTFWCSNVAHGQVLQHVSEGLRLGSGKDKRLLMEWRAPENKPISVVACQGDQLVCSTGNQVFYLRVGEGSLELVSECTLEFEVACISMPNLSPGTTCPFCVVGLWTNVSLQVLKLPSFEAVAVECLSGEVIPRSIVVAVFEDQVYLLCTLADGTLFYWNFNPILYTLEDKKKVTLGTQPTTLHPFKTRSTSSIFACSDHPAVIYSSNHKLLFSNVNLKEVSHVCPLNSQAYPDCLAVANEGSLMIGLIDDIQKLHIRTIPLHETPRRIVFQESTESFGISTFRMDLRDETGNYAPKHQSVSFHAQQLQSTSTSTAGKQRVSDAEDLQVHNFLVFDQYTFELLQCHQMGPREEITAITSARLGTDPSYYYIVGSCQVIPEEPEPKQGKITMFKYSEGKLVVVSEKDIKGAAYSILEFNGKLLISVNSSVRLYEWTNERELRHECAYLNNIMALYLKTKGDFILVGDLMRSITLLLYKPTEGLFDEIARDFNPNWMTGVEILDDETFLGAESSCNLFTCQMDSAATTEEDRRRLQEVGLFHLGDFVNVFKHGSLVMRHEREALSFTHGSVLFGTVQGSIGLVTQIKPTMYPFLLSLQKKLSTIIKSMGKIDHESWRSFNAQRREVACTGFIDGDLIESVLDLGKKEMKEVVSELMIEEADGVKRQVEVDEVIKIVEELTRIH